MRFGWVIFTKSLKGFMRNFIAFQEFVPQEKANDERCIWCKLYTPRNKAHIISKKLTISSHAVAVLKFTVCQKCNSKCGDIEQWILRYTPLAWLRFLCYLDGNKNSECMTVPSYFYANNFGEWLVYSIEAGGQKVILSQVLMLKDGNMKMFSQKQQSTHDSEIEAITDAIENTSFKTDINNKLPIDFSPRALFEKGTVTVISRTENDFKLFLEEMLTHKFDASSGDLLHSGGSVQDRQHFRWSQVTWLKFCAKISYEALCLFEGPHRCLEPEFEKIRNYVLSGPSKEHRELIFTDHGPLTESDTPNLVNADLTVEQKCPSLPALLGHAEAGMHNFILYECDGWICSSVAIAGFPPCFLVLAGPNSHLNDLYQMTYDEREDRFIFLKLAYDQKQPIIPLHVAGNVCDTIAKTYKLKPID